MTLLGWGKMQAWSHTFPYLLNEVNPTAISHSSCKRFGPGLADLELAKFLKNF
jgi:hypothetical protein